MGGFLLPNNEMTTIDDIRIAGLPPWLEYEEHSLTTTGQHYGRVFKSIRFPKALLNLIWCALVSIVLVHIGIRDRKQPGN